MLNHITIMGRLVKDPEFKRINSSLSVANFCVAVDRDFPNKETGEKETDFINCVAWRHTGEFVSKYFTKGSMIVVSGRLQIKKWTDRNEVRHYGGYGTPYVNPTSNWAMLEDDGAQLPF